MKSFKEFLTESAGGTISAKMFELKVMDDTAWCASITEPLRVKGHVTIPRHVSHLSKYITFTDRVKMSTNIKTDVVTGTFEKGLFARDSHIRKISDLVAYPEAAPDEQGFNDYAASFEDCRYLDVAEGTFYGGVSFAYSAVSSIGDLKISFQYDNEPQAASFFFCRALKVATGTYPGYVNFRGSGVTEIRDLHITAPGYDGKALDLMECDIQKISNFTYKGKILADQKTLDLIADYVAERDAEKITGKVEGGLNEIF